MNIVAATLDASYGRLQGASGQDLNHGHSHLLAYGGNNTRGPIEVATACRAKGGSGHGDFESETFVAHTLRGDGFDASEDGTGRGTPIIPVANSLNGNSGRMRIESTYVPAAFTQNSRSEVRYIDGDGEIVGALAADAGAQQQNYIAFNARQDPINGPINGPIDCDGASNGVLVPRSAVRRLMPVEFERLQGFPDNYTLVPWRGKLASDGVRYKAIGNSWATNCAQWIGRRIQIVEGIKP